MAQTVVGVNDPKTVKRWARELAVESTLSLFWAKGLMGKGELSRKPIQILSDLESDSGDTITFTLLAEMTMAPIMGDDTLEGREEKDRFYTDKLVIDQFRGGKNKGGRMTRKRMMYDLRMQEKTVQGEWWGRMMEQLIFIYLSGARGVGDYVFPVGYTGYRADQPFTPPDANHQLFGGSATAFNNITTNDRMSLNLITRAFNRAETMGGGSTNIPAMKKVDMEGEDCWICVMHIWQEQDLRDSSTTGDWLDLQKSAAAADGVAKSALFGKSLGKHRGIYLYSNRNAVRFNNAGAGANVPAARALFCGAQAGVVAFGQAGRGTNYQWAEDLRDNGNQLVITSSSMMGVKKTTYTSSETGTVNDFGVIALDTACATR